MTTNSHQQPHHPGESFLQSLLPQNVFYNDNPTVKGVGHDVTGGAQAIAHPLGTKHDPSTLGQTVHTFEAVGSGIGSIATFVTSGENWIRMGEVIAGVILVVMGLRTLAGGGPSVSATTSTVAKKVGPVRVAAKL